MGLGILGISAVESRSFQSKTRDSDLYSQVLDLTILLVHEFYLTRGSFEFNPQLMFLYETLLCHRGWAIVTLSLSWPFSKASIIVSTTTILFCCPKFSEVYSNAPTSVFPIQPLSHRTGKGLGHSNAVFLPCRDQYTPLVTSDLIVQQCLALTFHGRVFLHSPSQPGCLEERRCGRWDSLGELLGTAPV